MFFLVMYWQFNDITCIVLLINVALTRKKNLLKYKEKSKEKQLEQQNVNDSIFTTAVRTW